MILSGAFLSAAEGRAMPAGRPTELTPEVLAEVKRLLPVCMYIETVADYIGAHRCQIHRWLKRGAAEAKRLARNSRARPRTAESPYLEFRNTVKKALAEGLIHNIGVIKQASQSGTRPVSVKRTTKPDGTVIEETRYAAGEWTAAAWVAERRFPELWGMNRKELAELKKQVQALEKQRAALGNSASAPVPPHSPDAGDSRARPSPGGPGGVRAPRPGGETDARPRDDPPPPADPAVHH
jgi:hypothetical protein